MKMIDDWRDRRVQHHLQDMGKWLSLDKVRQRREYRESQPRGPMFSPGERIWIGITVLTLAAMWMFAFAY